MFHHIDPADAMGIAGFLLYAGADLALALRRLHSDQIRFYLISGAGAALILASLAIDFNMGAFLTESFALAMCLVAVAVRARMRGRAA